MAPVPAPTARQTFRPFQLEDAAGLHALNSDPEVIRFTGDRGLDSVEHARQFLSTYDPYSTEGMGRWAALDRATGELLGFCGLRRQEGGEVDLGYRYFRRLWNRGLATEASAASLDLAFGELGLASVIARALPENGASIRVIVKLGFLHEGPYLSGSETWMQYRIAAEAWRSTR